MRLSILSPGNLCCDENSGVRQGFASSGGESEAAEGKVAVRLRSGKDLGAMPLDTFLSRIKHEAESRKDAVE